MANTNRFSKMSVQSQVEIQTKISTMLTELNALKKNAYYSRKLRSCQANVVFTENYIVLVSYQTPVAFIDCNNDTLYDVLRIVYGYTSTSAQHIAKFRSDYRSYFNNEVRYYE